MRSLVVIILMPLIGCADSADSNHVIPFDSATWKEADIEDPSPTVRQRMFADLVQKHSFQGMTRGEILELLGEPTSDEPSTAGFPQWDLIYGLGIEDAGAYSLDDEALGFKFGADERVIDWGRSVN